MNNLISLSNEEFLLLRDYLVSQYGIWIEKEKDYLLSERLRPLLRELKMTSFHQFYLLLQNSPPITITNRIKELITTNESQWFRDGHPFEILSEVILPQLISSRPLMEPIRFLSAGSAKGQEAFSIAISIETYCKSNPKVNKDRFEIVAVDLNPTLVKEAPKGCFSSFDIERGMPDETRKQYFTKTDNGWVLDEALRNQVTFHPHNLMKPLNIYGDFDVIFYRNVMIYFSDQNKSHSLGHVFNRLRPGGYLLIGSMENLPGGTWALDKNRYAKGAYYQKRD
ncbi:MAG: protein-glutamate O-methyltransferase CheR [Candidatus Hinthialibacter antarcticus]|nr:protein-glutamate O-methyltransferase CheR [Candidatus Hinthialibacter antarcticus]